MTYRLSSLILALSATLAGCADPVPLVDSGELDGGSTGTGGRESGARDVDGGEGVTTAKSGPSEDDDYGGSTGSVEEGTSFGMTDDLPLAVDIPDIKRGYVAPGTWIMIEQVPAISERAILGNHEWFYVQDPLADAYPGLRVEVVPGAELPAPDRWLDLVGRVREDSYGWVLQLETATEGPMHDGLEAQPVDVAALYAPTAVQLDDALVEVTAPERLTVVQQLPTPGVFVVRDIQGGRSTLVDLRPFDLQYLQLMPGMQLERLTGVAEIGEGRPVVLPRTADDVVLAY